MAKICVTGIWHQGMVISAGLAELGNEVIGYCNSQEDADKLNSGETLLFEPILPDVIKENLSDGRLWYTTNLEYALRDAEIVYISTDTPVDKFDRPELTSVFELAKNIGKNLKHSIYLCVTAQVPVGACNYIKQLIEKESGQNCYTVYVPEFLRLGNAWSSFMNPDRIVIGGDPPTVDYIASIYKSFAVPIIKVSLRSAEMAKHASNAFLATSISFINELADLCEVTEVDILEVIKVMRSDKRIGERAFLTPGLGYAGGTLGREIKTLQGIGDVTDIRTSLMDAVDEVNINRTFLVKDKLYYFFGDLTNKQIGILGLTYKPGTSTLRRARSLEIIKTLLDCGAKVRVYDPLANYDELENIQDITICSSPYEVAQGSDALVLITEWDGIKDLDWKKIWKFMNNELFIDTKNYLDPEFMEQKGFIYYGIGR